MVVRLCIIQKSYNSLQEAPWSASMQTLPLWLHSSPIPLTFLHFLEHTRHILAFQAWHYFHSCLKCCSPDIYVNPHFCKSLSKCSILLRPTLWLHNLIATHFPTSLTVLFLFTCYMFFFSPFSIEICHFLKCQIIYYFTVCIVSFLSPLITI